MNACTVVNRRIVTARLKKKMGGKKNGEGGGELTLIPVSLATSSRSKILAIAMAFRNFV